MVRFLRSVLTSAAPIWAAVVGASLRTDGAVEAGRDPELQASPVPASATVAETEASPDSVSATDGRDCVVLLHGLGRTPRSMRRLASDLARKGYRVVNAGY